MGYLLENCTFCELTQEVVSRAMLTESPNPSDYLKKVKKRDEELAKGWGQIVTPLSIPTNGGNQRTNCANLKGIFRIIQSIPSPKAEPFKQWMAQISIE